MPPVSVGGGEEPMWRGDGREMFYLAPDGRLMAVPISVVGDQLQPQTLVPLFLTGIGSIRNTRNHYVVSHDGTRFLVLSEPRANVSAPVHVVIGATTRW